MQNDPKPQSQEYTKRMLVLCGTKKQYRDVLEACRVASTQSQIRFSMSKKWMYSTLDAALKRLVRAKLLEINRPGQRYKFPTLFKLTKIGERFLGVYPGNKKTIQYVIGGDYA